jgi:hypothetical protein
MRNCGLRNGRDRALRGHRPYTGRNLRCTASDHARSARWTRRWQRYLRKALVPRGNGLIAFSMQNICDNVGLIARRPL